MDRRAMLMAFAALIFLAAGLDANSQSETRVFRVAYLNELQTRTGVPVIDDAVNTAQQGVAFSLGEDMDESFRRGADLAARILRGAKPAELPVDNLMRVQLAVNAKSARKLGLRVPPSVLTRADHVFE